MRISFLRALVVLHRTFSFHPAGQRVHILGRFLTCPFLRTLHHVQAGGRVLDIGAGHGTFARLAIEAGAREVVAVEPDLRKVLGGFRQPGIRFVAAFDDAVGGTFDLITIFDVLYRMPISEWDSLISRTHSRLSTGGRLLIKEIDPGLRMKFAWNRAQERLWDKLFGLTLGTEFTYETREQFRTRLARAGFTSVAVEEIDAGYPHGHVSYVAER